MAKNAEERADIGKELKLLSFEQTALETCEPPQHFSIRESSLCRKANKLAKKLAAGNKKPSLRTAFLLVVSQMNLLMISDAGAKQRLFSLRERLICARFCYLLAPEYADEVAMFCESGHQEGAKAASALQWLAECARNA